MTSAVRLGVARLLGAPGAKQTLVKAVGVRFISSKTTRQGQQKEWKPAPWDYKNKRYNLFHYLYDKTTTRFDENTKVIVVEGPPASGKTKLAKELAEELEMFYMPEANLDMIYINEYGYDLKKLDDQVPESCRTFDVKDFLLKPKDRLTASFQMMQYGVKYSQYIDALAHVLSTGQGVVLDRCVYSDFVFTEAMSHLGYMSKLAREAYYDMRSCSINELLRPHLVLYLDVPVPQVQENIKKRNIGYEVNSPALTQEYLAKLEFTYKQQYLKEISNHAELLIYDWSHGGDTEVVIEDIERIDFNRYDSQDSQLKDWVYHLEEEWAVLRHKYTDQKSHLLTFLNVPRSDVPEFIINAEDGHEYDLIVDEIVPGEKFRPGYNTSYGDKGVLFKTHMDRRSTLPLRERRIQ